MNDMACDSRKAIARNDSETFRVLYPYVHSRRQDTLGKRLIYKLVGLYAWRVASNVLDGFVRSGWLTFSRYLRSQAARWIPARVSCSQAVHTKASQASLGDAKRFKVSSNRGAKVLHLHLASDWGRQQRSLHAGNGGNS